jgi:hypothetical protein
MCAERVIITRFFVGDGLMNLWGVYFCDDDTPST